MPDNTELQANTPLHQTLEQYFVDAITNLITADVAKQQAEQSEQTMLANLSYLSGNGQYTSAQDVMQVDMNRLVKESLNTHLEKTQSQQIDTFVRAKLVELQADAAKQFIGKKVVIKKLQNVLAPFEAVYSGTAIAAPRISPYTGSTIKGLISDLALDQNIILVEPTFMARKLTPNRILYRVHVLDIDSLQPQIDVQF